MSLHINKDEIVQNNSQPAGSYEDKRFAAWDADRNSLQAIEKFPEYFTDPDHQDKIDRLVQIIEDVFMFDKMYINQREKHPKTKEPFSVVKISKPGMKTIGDVQTNRRYYDPINALGGIEFVINKGTGGLSWRIL